MLEVVQHLFLVLRDNNPVALVALVALAGFAVTAVSLVVKLPGRSGSVETNVCTSVKCAAPCPFEPLGRAPVKIELSNPSTPPIVAGVGNPPITNTPGATSISPS